MAGVQRNTKQKKAVFDALVTLDHPTATEVYECVHAQYPMVSRGTVFRVLGGFAEQGMVKKLTLAQSDARYDRKIEPHAHGVCRVCGRVCDLFSSALEPFECGRICDGFHIDTCEVQFTGVCETCSKENMCRSAQ